jgi:hypothetical protein
MIGDNWDLTRFWGWLYSYQPCNKVFQHIFLGSRTWFSAVAKTLAPTYIIGSLFRRVNKKTTEVVFLFGFCILLITH